MLFLTAPTHDVAKLRAAMRATEQADALDALLSAEARRPLSALLAALPDGVTSADLVVRRGRLTARSLTPQVQKAIVQLQALRTAHRTLRLGPLELLPVRAGTAITFDGEEVERCRIEGSYVHRLDAEIVLAGAGGALLSLAVRGKVDLQVDRHGEMWLRRGASALLCNGEPLMADPDDANRCTDPIGAGGLGGEALGAFCAVLQAALGGRVTRKKAAAFVVAIMPALVPAPTPHP